MMLPPHSEILLLARCIMCECERLFILNGHNVFITGQGGTVRMNNIIAFYQVFFQQGRVALGK